MTTPRKPALFHELSHCARGGRANGETRARSFSTSSPSNWRFLSSSGRSNSVSPSTASRSSATNETSYPRSLWRDGHFSRPTEQHPDRRDLGLRDDANALAACHRLVGQDAVDHRVLGGYCALER